ncbi:DUF3373 domain-containing protein [Helicobacter sp. MIT 00-7814]|uniref:DUF3373 family protein n=1 Tax=unclassified Helicobacter TaxID=2593540 RepID=UPI000E1ED4B5|nr:MULTISPECIES: DUF3373 family protein [unclassified Helicobacter]RDU56415.1 DUF3373 domain-containing protein [Helicobacter sp. MIT 99-10781]RDU56498.1 DUF3373 domain-containing protein [Helicobacter sp. MIT 00-7814]
MKKVTSSFLVGALSASLFASAGLADEKALQKQIDELEKFVEEVETKAELNKIRFGLDFNATMNNVFTRNPATNTNTTQANKWAMGLYLNMKADINNYTKFTGRLSMTKAFGDLTFTSPVIGSLDAGRGVGGSSAIYVERAYVDLFLGNHFALTVGRLPGTDGPGSNLRNGSARMSTYPALAVNALGDGGVLTYNPFKDNKDVAVRLGFSKVYQPLYATEFAGAGSIFSSSKSTTADANIVFGTLETPFLPKSFGTSLAMLTFINLSNYSAPSASLLAVNSSLTGLVGNKDAVNLGDIRYLNVHFENDRLLGSGLNWFVSYTYSQGANSHVTNLGPSAPSLFAEESGYAVHVGLRYDFSSHFKLGYEYFHGSQYWYAFSRVSVNDPFNFRNTRGDVHDVYAIFQIDINQFFRLSYTNQYNKYGVAPLFAETQPTGTTNQNLALSYLLRF